MKSLLWLAMALAWLQAGPHGCGVYFPKKAQEERHE
jgi:hypothetical protein